MSVFTEATLEDITDEKRVHNQLQPENVVMYESGLDQVNRLLDHGSTPINATPSQCIKPLSIMLIL